MAAPAMSSGRPMRLSGALGRDLLAEGLEGGGHHLGLEGPRGDGVDRDERGQALGQVPGQLVHGGLGGRVGVRLEDGHPDPVDGADVDDPGRLVRPSPPPRAAGRRNLVRWKTPFTLRASTRSKAASSNSASGAPQVAPALLTRMSRRVDSRAAISSARRRHPASVDRSAGRPTQVPFGRELGGHLGAGRPPCATRCRPSAPASTKPSAIILPMPRVPPVTSAVLPAMEKRSDAVIGPLCPRGSRRGQCERAAHEDAGADAAATRPRPRRWGCGACRSSRRPRRRRRRSSSRAGGCRNSLTSSLGATGGMRRTWSRPRTTLRLRLDQVGRLGVVDHGRRVLGQLELDVHALVVADAVAQAPQAGEGLLVLGLGEGAQGAGRPGPRWGRR